MAETGTVGSIQKVLDLLIGRMPELRNRTTNGPKHADKNVSAPWIWGLPGGGLQDKIVGSQNEARRDYRTRHAAAVFRIFGKNYTEAEAYLHEVISAMHYAHFGRCIIGNSQYAYQDGKELSQYGDHFVLPVWFDMRVQEWNQTGEAQINSVAVENAGVSADPDVPPNPPSS